MVTKFSKPSKLTSERMKRVRSRGTGLEKAMEKILRSLGLKFERQPGLIGRPDFRIRGTKILIFCDSSFWHGRREEEVSGKAFRSNKTFWTTKLKENKRRDRRTNATLGNRGWSVIRFWDTDIAKRPENVKSRLSKLIAKTTSKKPTAIDLFSGAGGLTLGLKRAGFNVVAGVEVDSDIGKTYAANHPETKLLIKDIREVTGKELLSEAGLKRVDLVAGCPPCQGFTSLTSKYHRSDPRDDLVLEMARLIEEIRPKMVMMENVPGLANRGKPILDEFVRRLETMGYKVNKDVLQLADFGVPQSRRRFVLLAGKGFKLSFPPKTHANPALKVKGMRPWLTLADVVKKMKKPVTLSEVKKVGGPQKFNWHVVADLKEISERRLKALKAGNGRKSLPKELRPACHRQSDKGFPNVYGRLSWNQVPPTITSGCTTPAMGRFGHPDELRTISIREAAMIQTFPKSYRFKTQYMITACDMVGNALPPSFAEYLGRQCLNSFHSLEQSHEA